MPSIVNLRRNKARVEVALNEAAILLKEADTSCGYYMDIQDCAEKLRDEEESLRERC